MAARYGKKNLNAKAFAFLVKQVSSPANDIEFELLVKKKNLSCIFAAWGKTKKLVIN